MGVKINARKFIRGANERKNSLAKSAGKKISLLVAIAGASMVGGITTAVVMAAIPDGNGVIHACYSTGVLGKVRIIDSPSANCNNNETAIAWNQTGPQGPAGTQSFAQAYGYIEYDGQIDVARSVGINSVTFTDSEQGFRWFCLKTNLQPKTVMSQTLQNQTDILLDSPGASSVTLKGFGHDNVIEAHCSADTDALVETGKPFWIWFN